MSWQATSWAERQRTGTAARKALLLILANYADATGRCWPSQETLARGTELSTDTIQRQLKKLIELGLVSVERQPKRRGQWTTFVYQLHLSVDITEPHRAARSKPAPPVEKLMSAEPQMRPGRAATTTVTKPQALRLKPSIEPSIEPLRTRASASDADAQLALRESKRRPEPPQTRMERVEIIQNRIAKRLGNDGWLILGGMTDADRERITQLERAGRLDDEIIARAKFVHQHGQPP